MGKREPQTIDDRSIHLEIRAMANSPRNQPVAAKLGFFLEGGKLRSRQYGRWVLTHLPAARERVFMTSVRRSCF